MKDGVASPKDVLMFNKKPISPHPPAAGKRVITGIPTEVLSPDPAQGVRAAKDILK